MIKEPRSRSRRHWLSNAALGGAALLLASVPCSPAHAQGSPPGAPRGPDAQSVDMFYDALAPYGEWISDDQFGWVWSPEDVPVAWKPYTQGRWVYTDDGWFWESDVPWGWAAFHYGRWYDSPDNGWVWVPGTEWAPAWVQWRSGRGYLGWAPLPPRARFSGRGLAWQGQPEVSEPEAWSFVPEREFLEPRLEAHIEFEPRNVTLLALTRPRPDNYAVVNRRVIDRGPEVVEIERVIGHRVRPLRLDDAPSYRDARRQGQILRVYRPRLSSAPANHVRTAPPRGRAAGISQEQRERQHRARLEQIQRYEVEQRRALAERHAREEREARAEERAEIARRHERESREQDAEIARRRRAAQAAYERRRRAEAQSPGNPPRDTGRVRERRN
jgi:uncharacterized protein DUF6600